MLAKNVGRLRTCSFFLLANKRQTVRCDWLAVVNIWWQNRWNAFYVDYTNYTSPFYQRRRLGPGFGGDGVGAPPPQIAKFG